MPTIAIILLVLAAVAGVVLATRGKKDASGSSPKPSPTAPNTDAPLQVIYSPEPLLEAGAWAANYYYPGQYEVTTIGTTGSMLPTLQGGEVAVLAKDFPGVKVGKIVAYTVAAGSSPPIGSRLVHRVAEMRDGAALMKGDTEGMPLEDWDPVTASNYIGTLVAVFRKR